jgi:cobyric acid synthase
VAGSVDGLGLLDIETTLTEQKTLTHTTGIETRTGAAISGYEIHLGQTTGADTAQPMVHHIEGRDGIMWMVRSARTDKLPDAICTGFLPVTHSGRHG